MRHLLAAALVLVSSRSASADPAPRLDFGIFVDTYYAFDSNQPPNHERALTTLPARHNELAVNLAHLEGKISADRLRGRVAVQAGTSVQANYAGEWRDPAKRGVQLADALMFVQEAYAGYRAADGLWIDAGIFFSHVGGESFLSRDNWTYTRSLVADFSPYYQAGVRASYDAGPRWTFQLQVLNGWQNVVETNGDKAVGTQVVFRPTEKLTLTYNTLAGREGELRFFHDLFAIYTVTPFWKTGLTVDFGMQRRGAGAGYATWYGTSCQNRFQIADETAVAVRLESYHDPEGIIAPTGTAGNLRAWGASVNVDRALLPQLLWRNELRYLRATDAVFPASTGKARDTLFGITSLALSL